jgi:hypothetical protein
MGILLAYSRFGWTYKKVEEPLRALLKAVTTDQVLDGFALLPVAIAVVLLASCSALLHITASVPLSASSCSLLCHALLFSLSLSFSAFAAIYSVLRGF